MLTWLMFACLVMHTIVVFNVITYLKPSYFSGTLNLAIFVGNNIAYFYFSDFTENW